MSQSRRAPLRTYGSKPRKFTPTQLWDGNRDVPRRPVLGENTNELNDKKNTGLGGFMKGVVEWLSPKKPHLPQISKVRRGSNKENKLSKPDERFSLSDDEDDADTSVESFATLVATASKKEEKDIAEPKEGIELLLQFCTKDETVRFTEYVDEALKIANIHKLGEATYSEVFTLNRKDGTTAVLKIIPFNTTPDEKDTSMSNLEDLIQEIRISRAMANIEGFADFQGATVVKGSYPEQLLSAWDAYAQDKKTENERPSKFSETQTFCIIQLKHHGQDLESHSISTWSEAAHIFWSVVRALTRGEKECEFEHRDLHWGNIMIDRSEEDEVLERLLDNLNLEDGGKELLDGGWGGVKVTLIDYTLSRAKVNDLIGPVAHFAFEDESLFEGKRDYQFDIYRQMRALVSDENGATWEQYKPATNVLWLHYLADKLLYAKQLPTPVTRLSARNQSKQLGGARKRGHERSFSVILEGEDKEAYEGLFNIFGKINPKLNSSLGSASDVLELGKENGWAV